MPLELTLRTPNSVPIEVEGILPETVRDWSHSQVERHQVFHGNRACPLAEFFAVAGSAADGRIVFAGDLSGVHGIGQRMTSGRIEVEGNAGRHLGGEMQGGEIHVRGDAGDWVGGEMRGGLIHVHGRAGNNVAAAYRGSPRGMLGGTVLVRGPVGNELGHSLRRGLVAVGGCGDFAGINMIAGTVLVFGPCGLRCGAGMRRGTLGLLGTDPVSLLPTFRRGGSDRLLVVRLLFDELKRLGYPFDAALAESNLRMYHGDLVTTGRGEILVREAVG